MTDTNNGLWASWTNALGSHLGWITSVLVFVVGLILGWATWQQNQLAGHNATIAVQAEQIATIQDNQDRIEHRLDRETSELTKAIERLALSVQAQERLLAEVNVKLSELIKRYDREDREP